MNKEQTIAQFLNVKEFPFEIKDKNGNLIYHEDSTAYWEKREFDSKNNRIYYEDSTAYWEKREYDSNNDLIYYKNSNGYWYKQEFDSNNNRTYYENSDGKIIDNRPKKELIMQEIADKLQSILEDLNKII